MIRFICQLLAFLFLLSACETEVPKLGADGKPMPRLYNLRLQSTASVQFRMLDALNALRFSSNISKLALSSHLNAAAATHARDMSVQNRPWHFGSEGSSPIDRVEMVGYPHKLVGELISETFETEFETLSAWMENPDTRRVLLDKRATEMGFSWYQEPSGKIWWTMVLGTGPEFVENVLTNQSSRGG